MDILDKKHPVEQCKMLRSQFLETTPSSFFVTKSEIMVDFNLLYRTKCYEDENSSTFFTISSKSEKSSGCLDQLIFDSKWKEAKIYIMENGRCARQWRRCPQFMNNRGDSFVLPIHLALTREDVPMDFLESLIFAYPESIEKRETFNHRNCIHIAIKSKVPDYIIFHLLHMYPLAVQSQDIFGRIPLHYAVSNHRSLPLISELIALCPASIAAQDKTGWSPLHVAVDTLCSHDVIQLFLLKSKALVVLTTQKGKTPLDIAQESDCEKNIVVRNMLEMTRKKVDMLPIVDHFRKAEIRNKNMWEVMSETSFV